MPKRRRSLLTLALLASAMVAGSAHLAPAAAKERRVRGEEAEEEVDHLALAARLVADGHYERAAAVLEGIDQTDEKLDLARLHFLRGTIYAKRDLHGEAVRAFERSLAAGQQNPAIHIYLAQAHFQLGEFAKALAALDRAGDLAHDSPGSLLMRAESHWKLAQPDRALAVLDQGGARFPDFAKMLQVRVAYLIELGLYQEVVRVGERYLARPNVQAVDFVAIAEALRRSKQLNEARLIMERARLRFPHDAETSLLLASIYRDLDRPLTSAMLYELASRGDAKYSFEAAELYKESGRLSRALSLNARILDPQKKLKQRLAILLQMERYEMVAAMEPSLSRAGLTKDEHIRYALAYGYYKNGDFESAENHLKQLSNPSIFEKATALRKAMATCREAGWACY